ncbi:MAG: hypothetical protein M3146_10445 [Thermoproteota archaeon]|nr:hypothetical protein [Thermoproteota archaeon]
MTHKSEEPFFQEKGKITGQKDIGDNRSQITFSGEGAIKGNIEVINSGDFIEVQKGNNVTHAQGQGALTTKDGSEKVSYTFHAVGNVTGEGKPILLGSAIYSTDSKGKLAFLNNVISFFKVEVDSAGNFLSIERELK